jgi:hypothetical protein
MNMPERMFAIAVGVAFASSAFAAELAAADYLTPRFQVAGTYSNVFSISRSIKAEGYDELVGRNGGSADYAVIAATPPSWRFRMDYRYDGQPIAAEDYELRDGGRKPAMTGNVGLTPMLADSSITRRCGVRRPSACQLAATGK